MNVYKFLTFLNKKKIIVIQAALISQNFLLCYGNYFNAFSFFFLAIELMTVIF